MRHAQIVWEKHVFFIKVIACYDKDADGWGKRLVQNYEN